MRKFTEFAEVARNNAESTISEYGYHSTKFHIKIRQPHFKLLFYKENPFK